MQQRIPQHIDVHLEVGTEPSVCSMSRYVAWADTSCADADVSIPAIAAEARQAVSAAESAVDLRIVMLLFHTLRPPVAGAGA